MIFDLAHCLLSHKTHFSRRKGKEKLIFHDKRILIFYERGTNAKFLSHVEREVHRVI